jgi:transposase InsO family protein
MLLALAMLVWGEWLRLVPWASKLTPVLGRRTATLNVVRSRRKPEWVTRQLVLLKAHLPDAGCRTVALTFNRVFAHRQMSVSKSFVNRVLRDQAYAVWLARQAIRSATPKVVPLNHTWGIDLTGRQDGAGRIHTILGVLDHGSRRVLALRAVATKSGWHLLGYLCLAIAEFGKPKFIRTDNERCFTGRVFSTGLKWLGIGHQRIDLHCPWQNGRVERFFGTLKRHLKQWQFDGRAALQVSLTEFAAWYNGIRPHQNLAGLTPLEAWHRIDPFHAPTTPKDIVFVHGWDSLLRGFHIRR